MKRYSKEWWLKQALDARDSSTVIENLPSPNWDVLSVLREIEDYCFKRYAEAYHREKMAQCMRLTNPAIEERERILGIIEEEGEIYSPKNPFESAAIMFKNELIEKIKE